MTSSVRRTTTGVAIAVAAGLALAGCSDVEEASDDVSVSVAQASAEHATQDGRTPSTQQPPAGHTVAESATVSRVPSPGTDVQDVPTDAADAVPAQWLLTAQEVERTRSTLERIPVKGKAPKTGYDRDEFGPAWTDDVDVAFGHNHCRTRDDILARDLTNVEYGDDGQCQVETGTLLDPYTGKTIDFQYGKGTSQAVHIDHVVALGNAWITGAQQLSEQERTTFANDPRNLLAVDGPANMKKSDSDAASWLPKNTKFRCRMVGMQVDVKDAYGLWVTQPEKDAITDVLGGCTLAGDDEGGQDAPAHDGGSIGFDS